MKTWPPSPTMAWVGRAVPVVLEAPPIQVHHPLDVLLRPEDVVVEEAVAVVGGLLGDLRTADRAVPDERRHAVERPRRRGEAGQRGPELALPVDDVLSPQSVEQGVVLVRQRDSVPDVLAEPGSRPGPCCPRPIIRVDPAVGEMLEHRVSPPAIFTGSFVVISVVAVDRIRPLRPRGDVAEHRGRRGGHERRVVVLARGEHVQTGRLVPCRAIATIAWIRSASLGACVRSWGSVVTSP